MQSQKYSDFPSPCYIMEEELLRRNLQLIRRVADEAGVQIILAFKAFALWRSFPIFREYIAATTASSLNEARLAAHEFGAPAHTYSPAYTPDEMPQIVACSSHITFNSLSQLRRFYPVVQQCGAGRVSCGLRVNPEYSEIETELYNPCAAGSRFGVLAAQLGDELPQGVEGFHCHNHCESSAEALARSLVHLQAKFGRWLPRLKWLNLGGGHLMTRQGYNVPLLIDTLRALRGRYPGLQVILEPGSAFAWQTGVLLATVVDVVESHGVNTAILNVSFTCHMPDCLEMPYQPAVRGARSLPFEAAASAAPGDYIYRLGGNSCLSGDYMGSWQFDHPLQPGEQLVFEDMIHYTTVKTNMFNGIAHPSLGLLHSDGRAQILRTFGYEDYKNRMC